MSQKSSASDEIPLRYCPNSVSALDGTLARYYLYVCDLYKRENNDLLSRNGASHTPLWVQLKIETVPRLISLTFSSFWLLELVALWAFESIGTKKFTSNFAIE